MFGLIGFILGYIFRIIVSIIFKIAEFVIKTGLRLVGFFAKRVQKCFLEMRTPEHSEYDTDSLTKYALNINYEENIAKNISGNNNISRNKNDVTRRTQRV